MFLVVVKIGNLIFWFFLIVKEILFDKDKKCVIGVEIIDVEINEIYIFKSKIIFVNVLVFNLVWVLMNFVIDVWDGGLGSSSGELGYNVMDYYFRVGVLVEVEGFDDKYIYGCRLSGFYVLRFRNWGSDKWDYLCGFGY